MRDGAEITLTNAPRHIGDTVRDMVIRAALNHKSASTRKTRLMMLYEHGILTAGDMERLIQRHGLKHA